MKPNKFVEATKQESLVKMARVRTLELEIESDKKDQERAMKVLNNLEKLLGE